MTKPQRVIYFKRFLEDKPGALLSVLKELKSKNIGLIALWGFGAQAGRGELFVIPKNPVKLRTAWGASSVVTEEGTGFFLKGTDKTGVLVRSLEAIAQAGVNITAINAVAVGGRYGSFVWVPQSDDQKVSQALGIK